jgi:murein DD-endopeptidase MepM/ murein hydrolase activator NlpD
MVLIKHAAGFTTAYAHLNRIAVDKYSRVKQGDIIGYVGSTGNVKEPQLHFAMRNGKKEPLDPQKYLGK